MKRSRFSALAAGLLAVACVVLGTDAGVAAAAHAPTIFWASDPVRPDETVLVQGADFGPAAVVEVARLEDGKPTAPAITIAPPVAFALPTATASPGASAVPAALAWRKVPVLQASDCSLKFALPADAKMGVFAFRVTAGGAAGGPVLLNAPDPWWVQGDRGETATPGGWIRVLGKCLNFGGRSLARLQPAQGQALALESAAADGYSLRFALPPEAVPGDYAVSVHNGLGGDAAWRPAGTIRIEAPPAWPATVFSVLDFYGKDAEKDMRKSLVKYNNVKDRTEGIQAALAKAKASGGGVVYFPAGRYGVKGEIAVPPRTVLRGEGTGLVVLWWGEGRFNLDGGGDMGYTRPENEPKPPGTLMSGRDFALEDMSLYLPPDYETAIAAHENVRVRRVRVRIDHAWTLHTKRYEGTVLRMGKNCEVSDCDVMAKGCAFVPGDFGLVTRNRVMAGKTPCPLGGARQIIVEDNRFTSTHPTAYQNIAGQGKNLYYARNEHDALHVHQADYSFTFDAGPAAYGGKVAEVQGTRLTLAADPEYPKWALESSSLWKRAVVCIMDGRGAGQYRAVLSNKGRAWEIDRPFDVPPDASSVITIVPMNGRALVVGNRFEDANWVNAGFGTSVEVIYAGNTLVRCAQLLNYGIGDARGLQPSWYVQYLENAITEGQTGVDIAGHVKNRDAYAGPVTRCVVQRRTAIAKDNGGSISVAGSARDVIVEGCVLAHPMSTIKAD
ncbi:MAG: glycosyl hydrolase family 28-related protein, partial [Planctomycetota bacterium]|nr:glycosyl hydrolase family 28-related protein [Planctomycetota bacterium]